MEKTYDFWLVLASIGISVLTSFLAIAFANLIYWHKEKVNSIWHWVAAMNLGLGIWGMHFTGMLALHIDVPFAFSYIETLISAFIAVAAAYLTFSIIIKYPFAYGHTKYLLGSLVLGSGVWMMHYLGMDAMKMFPPIQYDERLVALSIIIAYGSSFAALFIFDQKAHHQKNNYFSLNSFLFAMVMGGAIAGMHYTGMMAASFDRGSYCSILETGLPTGRISAIVMSVIGLILLTSFLIMLYEQKRMAALNIDHQRKHQIDQEILHAVSTLVAERTVELKRQKELTEEVIENLHAVVVMLNSEGEIELFNEQAHKVSGYLATEVVGKKIWEILTPPEKVDTIKQFFNHLDSDQFPYRGREEWLTKSGLRLTLDWSVSVLLDNQKQVLHVLAMGIDVTQAIEIERQLRLSAVAFNTQEALVITNPEGTILRINAAFEEITGYSAEEAVGRKMNILKSGRQDDLFYQSMWRVVLADGFWSGEIWNRRKNGEIYPQWLRITKIVNEQNELMNYVGNFSDISEKKHYEAELEKIAFYDTITGLPNRYLFEDRLKQAWLVCRENHHRLALFFIDMDDFKRINDTKGHAFGDELLRQFSELLQSVLPEKASVGRFGGDEFLVLLPDLPDNTEQAGVMTETLAKALVAAFKSPCVVNDETLLVSASIGITLSDCPHYGYEELLKQADTAMYMAKSKGKNTFQFFSEAIQKAVTERIVIEDALKQSLVDEQDFYMVYQP